MLEGRILICKAKSILHPHSGWFCVSRVTRAQQAKASNKAKEPLKSAALLLVLLEVTHREVVAPQNGGAANDLHVNLTESYGIGVSKTILVPKR